MATSLALSQGLSFDEYRLVQPLGQGAMGQVWLGHDTVLDRPVAIKFISAVNPDEVEKERFLIEARAIARLSHPNVVAIYRVSQVAGLPYLVSELIRGQSLEKLARPQSEEEVLRIGLGIGKGLKAAHVRGVLHRDVKPANVMLSEEGEVKLLDFGLAKLLQIGEALPTAKPLPEGEQVDALAETTAPKLQTDKAIPDLQATASFHEAPSSRAEPAPPKKSTTQSTESPALTSAGVLIGTPRYMAPEVWRCEAATVASDLYSLGAILFELRTGRPPHKESTLQDLQQAVTGRDAPSLLELAPDTDPRLCAVVDRCLRRDPRERFASADEVVEALLQVKTQRKSEEDAPALPPGNPYRGLSSFEAQHRSLFFGRGAEVREILDLFASQQMVVCAGDSGVGKSSLCRAGVVPLVCEGALGDGRRWQVAQMVPGRRPVAALGAALLPVLFGSAAPSAPSGIHPGAEDLLRPELAREPTALMRKLRRRLGEGNGLLIFVDQGEELCTQADPAEAALLAEILGAINVNLGSPVPGVRVLLSARSDFLTRLSALPGLGDGLSRSLYLLRPLSPSALRDAITGPAQRRGVYFESESLVAKLVDETAKAEGGLPLLQFALAELWEQRDPQRHLIPASALEKIGGVEGALARHADGVISNLPQKSKERAQAILSRMVSPKGTRIRRTQAELPESQGVLEALVRGRLLSAHESETGTAYEVAHEALISGWGTLKQWLDESTERRTMLARVEAAATEWERMGRAREGLFSERQMQEAHAVDLSRLEIPERERAFLKESHRAIVKRRWLLRGGAVMGPILIMLVYAGVKVKEERDLHKRASGHISLAEPLLNQARAEAGFYRAEERHAYALFEKHPDKVEEAERTYTSARKKADAALRLYAQASRELEAAAMLTRERVRNTISEVLFEEALLQLAVHRKERADDLVARLAYYDDDGRYRGHFSEPVSLQVTLLPPSINNGQVVLHRYVEEDGRVFAGKSAPIPILRSQSGGFHAKVPPGSYLAILSAPGYKEVRYPMLLGPSAGTQIEILLPERVPQGMVYIPPGWFLYGSAEEEAVRRGFLSAQPQHPVHTGAYLIGRTEVTFAKWIEYLRALPPAERQRRLPQVKNAWGELSLTEEGSGFRLSFRPTTQMYSVASGEPLRYPGRPKEVATQDWLSMPVSAISYEDAQAYVEWLAASGRMKQARLCTEEEWERAARGADERIYPHGRRLHPTDANFDETYGRNPLSFGPDEVGKHPASTSPFGLEDMAGNVWEWTRGPKTGKPVPIFRGGSWYQDQTSSRSENRQPGEATMRMPQVGLRICADP